MFDTILIANRGEIACRVIRTARRMGLRTVAVYSDADAAALHVEMADRAVRIGPPPARESYLDMAAILRAAAETGAQAIHPGYGFLSENAAFAEACAKAGVTFIGPTAEAIRAMGSKSEAKALMERAGVPLVPGYHGEEQDPARLAAEADRIGYPVLIKASAGGGGKGMRLVHEANAFADSLASCRREASASFGDDRVLIERFVTRPRHIEMQVFADTQGSAVHLFERDCSVQRRHQKVIEEAPAPGLSDALRRRMGEAAVEAAQAIGYVGAGTVEFIVECDGDATPRDFFFMEMNTRLQVEHPVTEMVTGLDLVEWQLRVAAGDPLPLSQDDIRLKGHAFEARLYAEDPAEDFLPSTGRLTLFRTPEPGAHVRIDTGVREGDAVSIHYDPMIAKAVAWDVDRPAALRRLRRVLEQTRVAGLTSNRDFLLALARDEDFAAARLDTGLIDRRRDSLIPERKPAGLTVLALAAVAELKRRETAALARAAATGDPTSPWVHLQGWRLNDVSHQDLYFVDGAEEIRLRCTNIPGGYRIEAVGSAPVAVFAETDDEHHILAEIDGRRIVGTVVEEGVDRLVILQDRSHRLVLRDPLAAAAALDAGPARLTAPMPGKITAISVAPGERVSAGDPLLVLEAMKMEHTIAAPRDGVVADLPFAVGDQVEEGAELITFEEE